jgi:glycosyltransferase involved in cell wall biosynthesis
MTKVIHIIPYDGVGGVESAARSMSSRRHENIEFEVDFIFKNIQGSKGRFTTFNPVPLFSAAVRASKGCADVVIVSLWRSSIVGVLAKLMSPKIKLIAFLHSPVDVHWFDFIFTRISVWAATEVWADSHATLLRPLLGLGSKKIKVISFVTQRLEALPARPIVPNFIFWGRVSQEKRIDRAMRIFAKVLQHFPDAKFLIIGPDCGAMHALIKLRLNLRLEDAVVFLEPKPLLEIISYVESASFYLQASEFEGMAMSVVESMQLGLVPVVTPVGEIASYCKAGENAVIVESDEEVVKVILNLLSSYDSYQVLRANAIATWTGKPLYRESIFAACAELINRSPEGHRST